MRLQPGTLQQMASKDNLESNGYQDFPPNKKLRQTSLHSNGPLNLHIGSSNQQQLNLPPHIPGAEGREGAGGEGWEQLYLRAKTLQELNYPGHGSRAYEYPHHQYYKSQYPYGRPGEHHQRLIDSSMELQQQQQHHAALMANSSNQMGSSKAHQAGPSLTPRHPTHR